MSDPAETTTIDSTSLPQALTARELVERIRHLLTERTGPLEPVFDLVCQLADRLEARCARAEEEGRFEEIIFEAPWLTARAERVKSDQSAVCRAARELADGVRGRTPSESCRDEITSRIDSLIEQFLECEAGEYNLLCELVPKSPES